MEALKNLCIAQRPLFAAIDMVNTKMIQIKKIAAEAGVQFLTWLQCVPQTWFLAMVAQPWMI